MLHLDLWGLVTGMNNGVPKPGWLIGTICYMDQEKIRLRASRSDFSDRMLNGEPRHFNGLNQYLFAYLSISTKVIFRVVSAEEAERPYSDQPSSRFSTSYIFTATPIGEIEKSTYVPGVVDLPMVGSNVYACDESILKKVFCVREGVEIGSPAGYDSVRPTFDIDSLFSGHLAILGNTGSGKSSTARLLLDRVASLLDAENAFDAEPRFIVFDLHGDYDFLTRGGYGCTRRIDADEYHLAPGELSMDDWSAILDPSRRIQKPLLERAVRYSHLNEEGKKKLFAAFAYTAIRDTSIDSHAARKFQVSKYYQPIEKDLDAIRGQRSEPHSRARIAHNLLASFNLDYGNISKDVVEGLESLLKEFIEDEYMSNGLPNVERILCSYEKPEREVSISDVVDALDFVFDEEEVRGNRQIRSYSEGLVTQLRNLRERYSHDLFSLERGESIAALLNKWRGILVLDVSQIIDEPGLKLFSHYVARTLFQASLDAGRGSSTPVYLIFDEAHRYIRDADLTDDSVFNRIAREGRKFGIYLTAISQIPSELSRVVLSQTGTFIIHRIQNSYDLDYVRRNIPSISNGQVMRLPAFAPGTATALGSSITVPLELQIDDDFADETPTIRMMKSNRIR